MVARIDKRRDLHLNHWRCWLGIAVLLSGNGKQLELRKFDYRKQDQKFQGDLNGYDKENIRPKKFRHGIEFDFQNYSICQIFNYFSVIFQKRNPTHRDKNKNLAAITHYRTPIKNQRRWYNKFSKEKIFVVVVVCFENLWQNDNCAILKYF